MCEQAELEASSLVYPKPCNNRKCCGKYLFYAEVEKSKVLLPLTKVDVKAELRGATADTNVELTYINPSTDSPLECTYTFPLEKTSVLAKFEAVIDDKVVVTKVTEKESAQEKYDDAIAGGHAAVIAERKKKDETLTVKLGNLLPGQRAILKIQVVSQLEIVGGQYAYILPMAFYPEYKKHGIKDKNAFIYEFSYETRIFSKGRIVNLSIPTNAAVSEQNEDRTAITVRSTEPSRTIDLYYRTQDMMVPQLQYARSPDSDKIAVSASLVPTFDPVSPQDIFEVVEDEKPEQVMLNEGSEFHFIFIIDRSGSMGCSNRMELAKEAMDLFIRSLPQGCTFSIISFGCNFDALECKGETIMVLDDDTRQFATKQVQTFQADYGGTEILQPLWQAQEGFESGLKKRIFLLTDGSVSSPQQVIEQARKHRDTARVFSFGLGSGCDKNLVINSAKAGRGTHTIVKDGDSNLNGLVVRALSNAMQPSLCETKYGFNGEMSEGEEMFRNSLVASSKLMSEEEFSKLSFQFQTKEEQTKEAINLEFQKDDFKQVEGSSAAALFKMAAFSDIEKLSNATTKKELSVKYQVLCDETAIIGVQKQTNQATGELQETTIKFGRENLPDDMQENSFQSFFGGFGGGFGGSLMAQPQMQMQMAPPQAPGLFGMAQSQMHSSPQAQLFGMAQQPQMQMQMMQAPPQMAMKSAGPQYMMHSAAPVQMDSFAHCKDEDDDDCLEELDELEAEAMDCDMDMMASAPMNNRMASAAPQMEQKSSEVLPEMDDLAALMGESSAPVKKMKMAKRSSSPLAQAEEERRKISVTEEQKERVDPTTSTTSKAKPDFRTVMQGQIANGSWPSACRSILASCIDGDSSDDADVLQALAGVTLTGDADQVTVYLTLLAWYILEEAFADYEDEWQLIIKNAKLFLEKAGLPKPAQLVKKFTLSLRE